MGKIKLEITKSGEKRLYEDSKLWMTNRKCEYDQHEPVKSMYGHVVLVGLGIGLAIEIAKKNEKITKITVVEVNKDIINLIKVPSDVKVVHADAFKWIPDEKIDCVWLDIWTSHYSGRKELIERYKQWASIVECWPYLKNRRSKMADYQEKKKGLEDRLTVLAEKLEMVKNKIEATKKSIAKCDEELAKEEKKDE